MGYNKNVLILKLDEAFKRIEDEYLAEIGDIHSKITDKLREQLLDSTIHMASSDCENIDDWENELGSDFSDYYQARERLLLGPLDFSSRYDYYFDFKDVSGGADSEHIKRLINQAIRNNSHKDWYEIGK